MLRKLLKFELKATARIFLPLYIVLFSFALVNRLVSSIAILEWQAPQVITMTIYIAILVTMFVVTFIMMIQRFYKNLLSDGGYLMFTLPTKPWKHIISKLLVSMMWIVTSGIAAFISIFIIAGSRQLITEVIDVLRQISADIAAFLTLSSVLFILELLLFGVISLASGILIIYASIALGHLFNQNRIIASVGAFIALSTLTQILIAIVGAVFTVNLHVNDVEIMGPVVHSMMWFIILLSSLLTAGYFIITNYILSKRLNLE